MPTGRDNPPPISPLMAKFAVSSASLLLGMMLSAAAPEAGAAPATLAASIGLPIGEFVKEHLGNLDLHGEDITAWVTRGERDPHRHIRNKDIHAVAGLTIKTLIEGYIKLHPKDSLSSDYQKRLRQFDDHWKKLNPSDFPDLVYLQGRNVTALFSGGAEALYEKRDLEREDWQRLLWYLLVGKLPDLPRETQLGFVEPLVDLCLREYAPSFTYLLRNHPPAYRGVLLFIHSELLRQGAETKGNLEALCTDMQRLLGGPQLTLFEPYADREDDSYSAYLFKRRIGKVLGREVPKKALFQFLHDEPETKFQWARLTGRAGVGKSRLALEFAESAYAEHQWYAGFLPYEHSFQKWDAWRPVMPTLLVVDYAAQRQLFLGNFNYSIGKLTALLHQNAAYYEHPVRLLLIDRERDGLTWDRFFQDTGDKKSQVWKAEFDPPADEGEEASGSALNLKATDDRTSAAILRSEIERLQRLNVTESIPSDDELGRVVTTLADQLHEPPRPLFLHFAARALAEGYGPEKWSADSLAELILDTERDRWDRVADHQGIDAAHLNAFCLATLTGGMPLEALTALPEADGKLLPNADTFRDEAFGAICSVAGGFDKETVPALLPDLLGELFVLQRLAGTFQLSSKIEPNERRVRQQTEQILALAWRQNPRFVAEFIERTAMDYWFGPKPPTDDSLVTALTTLCRRPEGGDPIPDHQEEIELLLTLLTNSGNARASAWAVTVARRLAFEWAGRGAIERGKAVLAEAKDSRPVARALASGLVNATVGNPSVEQRLSLARQIEALYQQHDQDLEIARQLAKGLVNTAVTAETYAQRLDLSARVRTVYHYHPEDAEIAGQVLRALLINVLFAPTETEGAMEAALEAMRQEISDQLSDQAKVPGIMGVLTLGINFGRQHGHPAVPVFEGWLA